MSPNNNNPKSLSEFRPISVTPIMSRLAEKLVVDYWLKPAIPTDLLLDQFAFKLSGSTTCASIQLLDFVSLSLDRPGCSFVRALLIDFAKAFDTIYHSILITKLNTLDLVPSIKKLDNFFFV